MEAGHAAYQQAPPSGGSHTGGCGDPAGKGTGKGAGAGKGRRAGSGKGKGAGMEAGHAAYQQAPPSGGSHTGGKAKGSDGSEVQEEGGAVGGLGASQGLAPAEPSSTGPGTSRGLLTCH